MPMCFVDDYPVNMIATDGQDMSRPDGIVFMRLMNEEEAYAERQACARVRLSFAAERLMLIMRHTGRTNDARAVAEVERLITEWRSEQPTEASHDEAPQGRAGRRAQGKAAPS